MKEIKAIIQPYMVSKVVRVLHGDQFPGFTLRMPGGRGADGGQEARTR